MDLLLHPLQGDAQIKAGVFGFEDADWVSIEQAIWPLNIGQLDHQLEGGAPLIAPNFHPDLVFRDLAIVPRELVQTVG